MDNGLEGSKFLDFAQSVSERRRFRGCGVSLGRLGFAGGLGVMEAASAASLGDRLTDIDFGSQINTGFSFKWVIFARLKEGDFGVWGGFGALGLLGWAGAGQCCEFGPDWPISIWVSH